MTALNVTDFVVRFNDRRVLKAVILNCGFNEDEFDGVCIVVDKLDKVGMSGVEKELNDKGYKVESINALMAALENISKNGTSCLTDYSVPENVISEVKGIMDDVKDYAQGKYDIEFDFTLIRGMGYYTGSIFEIAYKNLGYSIAGGGRYDEMVGNFIGQQIPAIGFSIGFERLVNQLIEEKFKVPNLEKIVLLFESTDSYIQVMKKADEIRAQGYTVSIYEKAKKLGKQLNQFEGYGFNKYAVFNGDETEVKELTN